MSLSGLRQRKEDVTSDGERHPQNEKRKKKERKKKPAFVNEQSGEKEQKGRADDTKTRIHNDTKGTIIIVVVVFY